MATKVYRCSLCSCAGHNKTNCPTLPQDQRLARHIEIVQKRNATLAAKAATLAAKKAAQPLKFELSEEEKKVKRQQAADKRKAYRDELASQMPTPSAPSLPSPEVEISNWVFLPSDEVPAPSNKIALLEEALSLAQTRAREAEEQAERLTLERDQAIELANMLQVRLTQVEKECDQAKEIAFGLQSDNKDLSAENDTLKGKLDVALKSNTEALDTISNLLDENEKLSKSKLSDAEELLCLMHKHDFISRFHHDGNAANSGDNCAGFRRSELTQWWLFLQELTSQKNEVLDKERNADMVERLLNGSHWGNGQYGRPPHGYYTDMHIDLSRWLKQKGYLPADFTHPIL